MATRVVGRGATVGRAGTLPRARVRWWAGTAAAVASLLGGAPRAHAQPSATSSAHVLIVSGASGEPLFAERFHTTARTLLDALRDRAGVPAANMAWLAENPSAVPGRIAARSGRAEVERAFADLAARARAGDRVLIVLIGHGSHTGAESRVNLPGPDLTAADYARLLGAIRGAQVAFVNTASASGDFVPVVAAPNRIVVTATRTAMERNDARFGEFFAQAYAGDAADTDKDGRVSLLEAYEYARREVARLYERERQLLTERAVLDDDGDGKGAYEVTNQTADGRLARAFVLGGGTVARSTPTDPRAAELVRQRDDLEKRVADLRGRRESMTPAAYEAELERLLVELAETNQRIRALEGGRP